jgi:hypothetical protein
VHRVDGSGVNPAVETGGREGQVETRIFGRIEYVKLFVKYKV